jgi:uncharacterized protein (UPF0332 family)
MSVATTELLDAAQRIADNGVGEADWRGVCSRAYYAVYHDIRAFADSLAAAQYPGDIPAGTRGGMHHQLYTSLKNPTVPKSDPRNRISYKLGLMAQNLHSARIKADYDPTKSVDLIEATTNLTTAKNIPALIANQAIGTPLPKFGPSTSTVLAKPTDGPPPKGSGAIGKGAGLKVIK